MQVEEISRARSASTERNYGRLSGAESVGLAAMHVLPPAPPTGLSAHARSHGPRARFSDEQLVGEIRHTIAASPFSGEGHGKV